MGEREGGREGGRGRRERGGDIEPSTVEYKSTKQITDNADRNNFIIDWEGGYRKYSKR